MDKPEAYDYLHARFVQLAEERQIPVAPQFGSRARLGSPPYLEICADRWFSITHEQGMLDPQWNGHHDPAHMQVFADLDAYKIDVLWRLRCAWFTFHMSAEEAEEDVLKIVKAARLPDS
jgi:hypothetical protein